MGFFEEIWNSFEPGLPDQEFHICESLTGIGFFQEIWNSYPGDMEFFLKNQVSPTMAAFPVNF
jgi:hypothetical protein